MPGRELAPQRYALCWELLRQQAPARLDWCSWSVCSQLTLADLTKRFLL